MVDHARTLGWSFRTGENAALIAARDGREVVPPASGVKYSIAESARLIAELNPSPYVPPARGGPGSRGLAEVIHFYQVTGLPTVGVGRQWGPCYRFATQHTTLQPYEASTKTCKRLPNNGGTGPSRGIRVQSPSRTATKSRGAESYGDQKPDEVAWLRNGGHVHTWRSACGQAPPGISSATPVASSGRTSSKPRIREPSDARSRSAARHGQLSGLGRGQRVWGRRSTTDGTKKTTSGMRCGDTSTAWLDKRDDLLTWSQPTAVLTRSTTRSSAQGTRSGARRYRPCLRDLGFAKGQAVGRKALADSCLGARVVRRGGILSRRRCPMNAPPR